MIELDLRDIHLPGDVSWWPPAPGWWLLLLALILAVTLICWYWRRLRNPLRQASLRELSRLRADQAAGTDPSQVLAEVSRLLRRIAISRLGRAQVAGATGVVWQNCLQQLSQNSVFDLAQIDLLIHRRFQKNPECDLEQLLRTCEIWIRGLPRDGEHVSV